MKIETRNLRVDASLARQTPLNGRVSTSLDPGLGAHWPSALALFIGT